MKSLKNFDRLLYDGFFVDYLTKFKEKIASGANSLHEKHPDVYSLAIQSTGVVPVYPEYKMYQTVKKIRDVSKSFSDERLVSAARNATRFAVGSALMKYGFLMIPAFADPVGVLLYLPAGGVVGTVRVALDCLLSRMEGRMADGGSL